jgi:hypothetical protein
MAKLPLVFSYNYSNEPFVVVDEHQELEMQKVSVEVRAELANWAVFMHEAFDHLKGFRDEASRQQAVEEYHRLCELLDVAGVEFERDEWWNKKPTTSND